MSHFNILDHGYIKVEKASDNDIDIIRGARMSTGGEEHEDPAKNLRLMKYLIREGHTSPLEQASIKLRIKMPVFVARQFYRQRFANINEASGRYIKLTTDVYIPEIDRMNPQSTSMKQGSEKSTIKGATKAREIIEKASAASIRAYESLLKTGLANEVSRIVLPLNLYIEFLWKIDMNNYTKLLKQRLDPHAQFEIQQYALAMLEILKEYFPMLAHAFLDPSKGEELIEEEPAKIVVDTTTIKMDADEKAIHKLKPQYTNIGDDVWAEVLKFARYRREKGKILVPTSVAVIANTLLGYKEEGYDIAVATNESIAAGWQRIILTSNVPKGKPKISEPAQKEIAQRDVDLRANQVKGFLDSISMLDAKIAISSTPRFVSERQRNISLLKNYLLYNSDYKDALIERFGKDAFVFNDQ